ncbi:Derlin-2/3 [Nematocida sp. AWRm80]|nr:Derlin-2/3 [Nematocida sp. AWRm80]
MQIESAIINYYKNIPVVSRVFFSLSIAVTILTYLDILSSYTLIYSWAHMKKLELWRAITTFFYWGPAGLDVFVHQFFMLKYCVMLEESCSEPAEFLYMLMVGMGAILGMANIFKMSKLSNALSTYIIYVWSKKNPLMLVQYLGLFSMPAYYIPCIMFLFSFIVEKKLPQSDLVGIVAGHLYFYLKVVYVKTNPNRDPLKTPEFLKRLFKKESSTNNTNNESAGSRGSTGNTPRQNTFSGTGPRIATLRDIQ